MAGLLALDYTRYLPNGPLWLSELPALEHSIEGSSGLGCIKHPDRQ